MSVLLDKFAALSKAQGSAGTTDSAMRPQASQEDVRAFQMHLQGGDALQHLNTSSQTRFEGVPSMSNAFKGEAFVQTMQGGNQLQHLEAVPQKNIEANRPQLNAFKNEAFVQTMQGGNHLQRLEGVPQKNIEANRPQPNAFKREAFVQTMQGGNHLQHLEAVPQKGTENVRPMPDAFILDAFPKSVQGADQFQQSIIELPKNLEGSELGQKPVDETNALHRSEQGREMSDTSISSTHKSVDNANRSTSLEAPSQSQTMNKEPLPTTKSHEASLQDFANEMKSQSDATSKSSEPSIDSLFKDFAAMAAQMDGLTSPMPQVSEVQAKPATGLDAIDLNELVTRILVNTPESGKTEVRLTLQDNVLRGTEISIARDNDGLLTVRIVTDNAASFQTLVATRNDLQAILQQQEGRIIVNVEMLDDSDSEQNDSRRRSKGLYDDEEEKDV